MAPVLQSYLELGTQSNIMSFLIKHSLNRYYSLKYHYESEYDLASFGSSFRVSYHFMCFECVQEMCVLHSRGRG